MPHEPAQRAANGAPDLAFGGALGVAMQALALSGTLALLIDRPSGRIVQQWGRLSGAELEGGLGAIAEVWLSAHVHAADRPALAERLSRLVTANEPVEVELRVERPVGDSLRVRLRGERGGPEASLVTLQAVTGADAISDHEARLKAIVEHTPDPIYVRDLENRMMLVNTAGAQGLGLTPEQVIGKRLQEIMPPAIVARIVASDDVVLENGQMLTYEAVMRNLAGMERIYLISKYPYRAPAGEIVGLIGILRDITELKQLQAALADHNARLRQTNEQKSEFVSALSHELRTPLTFIKGYAEFLEDGIGGPLTETQLDYVTQIYGGIDRLERLVNDLLDFARLDAGTFKLKRDMGDLRGTIQATVDQLLPLIEQAGLHADVRLPSEPLDACIDSQRIGQVLTNLVTNAIKFSPRQGAITVRARQQEDAIVCEVQDTGPGIAPEDMARLFERFSQLPTGAQRGGLGLGLSISKALVEAHGGTIGVESTIGQGSTFWFEVPVDRAPCAQPAPSAG